jgi:LCP family protein required for cell wall assembly
LILGFFVFGLHVVKVYQFYNKITVKQTDKDKNKEEKKKKKEKKEYNIMLMGYGGEGHDGAYLTDTLMIANVNLEKKKVKLVSIPRDIWVKIPTNSDEDFYSKINAAYQMGLYRDQYPNVKVSPDASKEKNEIDERAAAELLKTILKRITGLEIDYFVAIDFQGFIKAVDTLDGIEVNVERAFDDYLYPVTGNENDLCGHQPKPTMNPDEMKLWLEDYNKKSPEEKEAFDNRPMEEWTEEEFQKVATESPHLAFPCRFEHLHFDAGKQTMDGKTALKFARSRKSLQDGGDFNRAARQQKVIQAVRDRVLSLGFVSKIIPLLEDLDDHVRMDIPFDVINEYMSEAKNAGEYKIYTTVISDENNLQISTSADGQSILIPQDGIGEWDSTKKFVNNYIKDITPTPTIDPTIAATASAEVKVEHEKTE